uniref:Uncharacterized protein n=1 Tax=Meloidogyne enterolobii TaxID=390850 RepID=A0A6V7WJL4_MELEN|nr:unnamed protein product [Meloidogyne enterolobii]
MGYSSCFNCLRKVFGQINLAESTYFSNPVFRYLLLITRTLVKNYCTVLQGNINIFIQFTV